MTLPIELIDIITTFTNVETAIKLINMQLATQHVDIYGKYVHELDLYYCTMSEIEIVYHRTKIAQSSKFNTWLKIFAKNVILSDRFDIFECESIVNDSEFKNLYIYLMFHASYLSCAYVIAKLIDSFPVLYESSVDEKAMMINILSRTDDIQDILDMYLERDFFFVSDYFRSSVHCSKFVQIDWVMTRLVIPTNDIDFFNDMIRFCKIYSRRDVLKFIQDQYELDIDIEVFVAPVETARRLFF